MKKAGFILASNVLALGIICLGIMFFLIDYQFYCRQRVRMDEQLEAARLCQEAADAVAIKGSAVKIRRHNLEASGDTEKIIVHKGKNEVISLWRM